MSLQSAESDLVRHSWMTMELCDRIAANHGVSSRDVMTLGFKHGLPFLSAAQGFQCPRCGNAVRRNGVCNSCNFDVRNDQPPRGATRVYLSQVRKTKIQSSRRAKLAGALMMVGAAAVTALLLVLD